MKHLVFALMTFVAIVLVDVSMDIDNQSLSWLFKTVGITMASTAGVIYAMWGGFAMTVKMPEPVAWWNPRKDNASTDPVHKHTEGCLPLITTEQAEAYAQARVNEVLDMMADKASQKYLMPEFANAIRTLKEK